MHSCSGCRVFFAVILGVDLDDSILGFHMKYFEIGSPFAKDPFKLAYGLPTPHSNKLKLAARVCQKHLTFEKLFELVARNVALNEVPLAVNMTSLASF